jgi:hypothetical protein
VITISLGKTLLKTEKRQQEKGKLRGADQQTLVYRNILRSFHNIHSTISFL